eukprot:CAMPEP_0170286286 /NCGR_PEP_ID=MMETSP0116_2-20130129/43197_1 /TAXON_ID=400756 /ORGANISM="Durinskia baltica, Strain CSIRO CS-38" /LENGTH=61 /DNA_ID=CAMNT_0010537697 /DNA_START=41 /DNA_END=222 /DNA_ORIENTATION=+
MRMQTTPIVSTATFPRVTSGNWDCDGDWDRDRSSSSSSSASLPSAAVSRPGLAAHLPHEAR